LLQVGNKVDTFGFGFCLGKGWQQHARRDGDDVNDHQQLNQGKTASLTIGCTRVPSRSLCQYSGVIRVIGNRLCMESKIYSTISSQFPLRLSGVLRYAWTVYRKR